MVNRDVPRNEWGGFLDRFSRDHRDEPVSVAKSDIRDGLRFAERVTPLMEIAHHHAPDRISVTVRETPFGEVTHTILDPDAVAVEEPAEADEDPRVSLHVTAPGEHLVVRVDRPAEQGLDPG
jgi:Family of unknown function (DUF5335)